MSFLSRIKESLAAPQRSRDRANKALRSDLVTTLADHLIKVMIYGHYVDHRAKWVKDIARQMRELSFQLSKFSRRRSDSPSDRTRIIKEMHVKAKDVLKVLDSETADAYWRVVQDKAYQKLDIKDPKGIERGVFSTLGFRLRDAEGPLGKGFQLFFDDELLVDTTAEGGG